jgi:hypothetical protein
LFLTGELPRQFDQVRAYVGFNVPVSHQVTAGADILLMPSRFEPCGLNQVRLRRGRFSPPADLGYRGTRGAVGLGYRFTVYKRTLPPAQVVGGGSVVLLIYKRLLKFEAKRCCPVLLNPNRSCTILTLGVETGRGKT